MKVHWNMTDDSTYYFDRLNSVRVIRKGHDQCLATWIVVRMRCCGIYSASVRDRLLFVESNWLRPRTLRRRSSLSMDGTAHEIV